MIDLRLRRSIVWMACLAALALGASAAAQQGAPPSPVRVDPVTVETVAEMRLVTGDLRAIRRSLVASQEPGLVLEMPFDVGQRVEAGAILARLDSRRLEIMLEQARADLDAAQATLAERQVDLDWRRDDLDLLIETSERAAASPKEMLDARAAASQAQARVHQAERALAVIDRAIELLQQRLADTEIRAPFAGVVTARESEVGEWLGAGDAVAEILEIDSLEAWINVPQRQFKALTSDSTGLVISIDALNEAATPVDVRILPQVDETARTFTVVARIQNDDGFLAPGMSLTAWAPTEVRGERMTISKNAVLRNETGEFAYVVRDGAAFPARVRILFPAGDRYVIESSELAPGDATVVEGNERLFPTAPVSVIAD